MSGANNVCSTGKGLSTLVRPRFGPGMLLQHDDLEQLSAYTREINRLMFRSLFGCGVICGLVVEPAENCGKVCVTVGAGLALDCCGNPVYVPKNTTVAVDENCDPNLEPPLYVLLCGTTKCCAPRTSMCATDEDEMSSQCTRERDAFEIRIVRNWPKCACGCADPKEEDADKTQAAKEAKEAKEEDCWCVSPQDPCYKDHYDGKCDCDCGECSGGSCDCILLARLVKNTDGKWIADHRVRRFIRPVLMRDPQVEKEKTRPQKPKEEEKEKQEKELKEKATYKDVTELSELKPPREPKTPREPGYKR
jgi:hypothetical protein